MEHTIFFIHNELQCKTGFTIFKKQEGVMGTVMEIENLFTFDGSRKENYIFTFKGSLL